MVSLRITINGLGRVAEVRSMPQGSGRMTFSTGGPDGRGRGAVLGGVVGGPAPPSEAFVKAAADAVRQWLYEPPADAPISFDVTFQFSPGAEARLLSHGGPAAIRVSPPLPPPAPPPGGRSSFAAAQGAVRIGGNIKPPAKVKNVPPEYPALAQTAGVQGVVIIEALISKEGRVEEAHVVRSIPLLDQAAVDAVTQWEFTPTMLNGQPVPVIMMLTVQFTLQQ
jgi:protein TonB